MRNGFVCAATKGAKASILLAGLAWPASAAQALDNPGGTAAPVVAPSTRGTGGTAYAAVSPKPRTVKKPVGRKPAPRHTPKPPVLKPPAPKPAPAPSGVPSPAQTAALGAFFPVRGPHSFGDAANRFGAGRVGHIHQGQDVLASEGLSVVAPLAGTIITIDNQAGGAGWYVAEQTTDGLAFFYAHCQAGSVAVSPEQSVRAGQQLCRVGQTGDATGPHLHFEVWVGGWRTAGGYPIDPLPYLEAWTR
ncbi:MAG TPA: peptidoglycan DD-metalloendopeptidase family protein [Solirubrobacteraceae bacterium]|jgi:murein DD-endopeptidase MepM/ murein hydrolase activator NlpD|nr:peptidoglycan DD-metalloendopeptidase family protein [Solirubrobacteraceae bacterium]